MAVEYRITLDDEHAFNYKIELERDRLSPAEGTELHAWTRLEHQKCSNCPLSKDQYTHCPAAADLQTVVEDKLAEEILSGRVKPGDKVSVGYRKEQVTFDIK